MLKRILGLLAVIGVLAYLVFAIIRFSGLSGSDRCVGVLVQVMDDSEHRYIGAGEVFKMLELNQLYLNGKRLSQIDYKRVEQVVKALDLVKRVESFPTKSGHVVIQLWQYEPVVRIMDETGSYYVDSTGVVIDNSLYTAADVLVATGNIKDSLQVDQLRQLALNFRQDAFWNAQMEQIHIEPNGEWVLIPRVGQYEIKLGLPHRLDDKLENLKLFYQKALPKVGWERYSSINLKYKNQIVCTIKED